MTCLSPTFPPSCSGLILTVYTVRVSLSPSLSHSHTHSPKCSEVRAERGQEENDWHTQICTVHRCWTCVCDHIRKERAHTCSQSFARSLPPWSTVLLRQQRLQRKTKTSHCCWFYYKLIAKHEVKISENQAAGVVQLSKSGNFFVFWPTSRKCIHMLYCLWWKVPSFIVPKEVMW